MRLILETWRYILYHKIQHPSVQWVNATQRGSQSDWSLGMLINVIYNTRPPLPWCWHYNLWRFIVNVIMTIGALVCMYVYWGVQLELSWYVNLFGSLSAEHDSMVEMFEMLWDLVCLLNFELCHQGFKSSPKFSLQIKVLQKPYFPSEFQAETLYVCPKPCFGRHTYRDSAWNFHHKCDFWHCIFFARLFRRARETFVIKNIYIKSLTGRETLKKKFQIT